MRHALSSKLSGVVACLVASALCLLLSYGAAPGAAPAAGIGMAGLVWGLGLIACCALFIQALALLIARPAPKQRAGHRRTRA